MKGEVRRGQEGKKLKGNRELGKGDPDDSEM